MDRDTDDYVRQQNIELYRKLLAEAPVEGPRRIILRRLLAEEQARQAGARTQPSE
jgi:hypothetical protein